MHNQKPKRPLKRGTENYVKLDSDICKSAKIPQESIKYDGEGSGFEYRIQSSSTA